MLQNASVRWNVLLLNKKNNCMLINSKIVHSRTQDIATIYSDFILSYSSSLFFSGRWDCDGYMIFGNKFFFKDIWQLWTIYSHWYTTVNDMTKFGPLTVRDMSKSETDDNKKHLIVK